MAQAFERPIVCPTVVGRERQLDTLFGLLERLTVGSGATLLLSGEAGIGKTRLAAETKAHALAKGVQVFQGNCFEPDRALPYAPMVDLLRRTFAACLPEEVVAKVGPAAPEVVKLLPELATILPNATPNPRLPPEQEKRWLFEALTATLLRCVEDGPAMIIIEDLHWCDDVGLEFLLHLARRGAAVPLVLLVTYRSDEVHAGLRHLLAELDRERLATELRLSPLDQTGVETMIQAIFTLGRPMRADFLLTLYGLTEGNPFFVEETLKSLVVAGDIYVRDGAWDRKALDELHIPRSVHDAVQRRTQRLSPAAREMLAVAAVAGQRFDFALIQEVTHTEEDALLEATKELMAAQLVVEVSAEQLAFRHALTRQAAYVDLLARERRSLHRAIAETLERLYGPANEEHLVDLAYHYYEAGVWRRALETAQAVGDRSLALYAPRAAVEQFTQALEASRQLTLEPAPSLHRRRGQAHETLGNFERAQADYEEALVGARLAGDHKEEWRTLLALGLLWSGRDYARAGDYYQQAFELAPALGDPLAMARSLNRLGNWYVNVDQPLEALAHHRQALALVEAAGEPRGIAETLDLLGMATWLGGDPVQAAAHYERAVALWHTVGDRQTLSSSLAGLQGCGVLYQNDTMVPAQTGTDSQMPAIEEAIRLARETGWRSGESFALWMQGGCLCARGDYAQALEVTRQGIAIADEIEHVQWKTGGRWTLAVILLDILSYAESRVQLEEALTLANASGSTLWKRVVAGYLALACIGVGDIQRAESLLDAALPENGPIQSHSQRAVWRGRAELALARGAPDEALGIMDRLVASTAHAERGIPRVAFIRGTALVALERWDEAETALRDAQAMARELGWCGLVWRSGVALGRLLYARQRRDEAEAEFAEARGVIAQIAQTLPDGPLRTTFAQRAAALLPERAHSPRRMEAERYGGLTAREREVARLVARGMSNRNIAGSLVLSERTVETHVTNILLKLSFTSRAQIAAWAAERGLAASDPATDT